LKSLPERSGGLSFYQHRKLRDVVAAGDASGSKLKGVELD
jgi:hypothetical protein